MTRCSWLARLAFVAALASAASANAQDEAITLAGRPAIVHAPPTVPPAGSRALVVVLHGGMGAADRIVGGQAESPLDLDAAADRYGFVVAYLNGTPVTRRMGDRFRGWNAGDCCGMPAETKVDDVGYVESAVADLVRRYGVDPRRVYGIGHSNGAMMTQRLVCETHLYAAAVSISGPLELDVQSCPGAKGARILALHGADDQNVPVAGGPGTRGLSRTDFKSEASSRAVMTRSGADYILQIVPGADHRLDHIEAEVEKTEGLSIGEKAARFFGLASAGR